LFSFACGLRFAAVHADGASQSLPSYLLGDVSQKARSDGPEQKVVQLYDALRLPIYRYLINSGAPPPDAEEIVQETFLRLYQHLSLGGNEDNLRSWSFKVAHNLAINTLKSRGRSIDAGPELWESLSQSATDAAPGPEEQLLEKERLRRIRAELEELTPLQRDCLRLRVEGFRYREIGEILNIGTSTVAGSLRNAISRIAKRHR
jgi:RNA polymerase sigma-70 factor (ECF subfamily)